MRWFVKLKEFFNLQRQNLLLKAENTSLKIEAERLKTQIGDPRLVVEKIFTRGVKWFDYTELTPENLRTYYNEAQLILNSKVFSNTINFLIAQQCQEHVRQYNPITKLDVARDVQMHINAWDLLTEQLKDIPDPDKPRPKIDSDVLEYRFAHQEKNS